MSDEMNQEGVTKARPIQWKVWNPPGKNSVAISILFQVEAMYDTDTGEWTDWRDYDVQIAGSFWVIGKDGKPLVKKVEQLANLLGWNGDLMQIVETRPPNIVLQVTSKEDSYEGKLRYRADWIDHEDADPTGQGGGATPEQVQAIATQFGSLLRAAASGGRKPPGGGAVTKPTTVVGRTAGERPSPDSPPPGKGPEPDPVDYSDIPF